MKSFMMKKVVYIGNDLELGALLTEYFFNHKIHTEIVADEEAVKVINTSHPDIVLIELQIHSPMDGYLLAKNIRLQSAIPILFTSSNYENVQVSKALYLQHVDHVSKPVNIEEMITRMNLLIARTTRPTEHLRYQLGSAMFNACDQMLTYNGKLIYLSRLQTAVLLQLFYNRNRHVDRPQLICSIWDVSDWKLAASSFQNVLWKLRKLLLEIEDVSIDSRFKLKIKLCIPE